MHEAQLPVPKTLADYDWNAFPDLERPQIEQLAHDTGWLDRAENLLLFGPSGVGKTHLAAGICRSLIALDRWHASSPSPPCYRSCSAHKATTPWPGPSTGWIATPCW